MVKKVKRKKVIVGWCEDIALPEFGIKSINAKMDTGALTSAIDASNIKTFDVDGQLWVRCKIYPKGRSSKLSQPIEIEAKITDERVITDSGGHKSKRFIIETVIQVLDKQWKIEVSLANRKSMQLPMLIGRQAMKKYLIVDSAKRYLLRKMVELQS